MGRGLYYNLRRLFIQKQAEDFNMMLFERDVVRMLSTTGVLSNPTN